MYFCTTAHAQLSRSHHYHQDPACPNPQNAVHSQHQDCGCRRCMEPNSQRRLAPEPRPRDVLLHAGLAVGPSRVIPKRRQLPPWLHVKHAPGRPRRSKKRLLCERPFRASSIVSIITQSSLTASDYEVPPTVGKSRGQKQSSMNAIAGRLRPAWPKIICSFCLRRRRGKSFERFLNSGSSTHSFHDTAKTRNRKIENRNAGFTRPSVCSTPKVAIFELTPTVLSSAHKIPAARACSIIGGRPPSQSPPHRPSQ